MNERTRRILFLRMHLAASPPPGSWRLSYQFFFVMFKVFSMFLAWATWLEEKIPAKVRFYILQKVQAYTNLNFAFGGPEKKNIAKQNMSSAMCAWSMYMSLTHSNIYVKFCTSRLCMKMLSFLFVRTWAMPHILYLPCGFYFRFWYLITFPV